MIEVRLLLHFVSLVLSGSAVSAVYFHALRIPGGDTQALYGALVIVIVSSIMGMHSELLQNERRLRLTQQDLRDAKKRCHHEDSGL